MKGWLTTIGAALLVLHGPAQTQVRTVDPNQGIDRDLAPAEGGYRAPAPSPRQDEGRRGPDDAVSRAQPRAPAPAGPSPSSQDRAEATTEAASTYKRDDLITAGEGVFGKGAEGLAGIIERILKDQGQPNAYIAGREAAGAFVVGVRYGSGVLNHRVEGQQPVYWTGPSLGFDVGGDATKVFALVYNLYDTADLYHRFPGAEGRLYFVGGFAATYLRRGNVVVIPIRLGVGLRAGVNVNYMRFSHKSKWLPF